MSKLEDFCITKYSFTKYVNYEDPVIKLMIIRSKYNSNRIARKLKK